jgi:hypothetical protein
MHGKAKRWENSTQCFLADSELVWSQLEMGEVVMNLPRMLVPVRTTNSPQTAACLPVARVQLILSINLAGQDEISRINSKQRHYQKRSDRRR